MALTLLTRNPNWSADEIILALDLYLSSKPKDLQKNSGEVAALSALLNRLHTQLGTAGQATLRNPAGVYMKLQNLKANDPEYLAKGRTGLKSGNQIEKEMWARYGHTPSELHAVAATIRAFIQSDTAPTSNDVVDEDEELAPEGRLLTRVHKSYERSRKNRTKKLAAFRKANANRVFCECLWI